MLLNGERFKELPDDLDGFACASRVASALHPNRIIIDGEAEHSVYFRNWGPAEVGTIVSVDLIDPRLKYVSTSTDKRWELDVGSVPSGNKFTKVETLLHTPHRCSPGNEHQVVVAATFRSRLPGAAAYSGEITLNVKCY